MKKNFAIGAALCALGLAACTNAQLTAFENGLNNFSAGVAATNKTIAQVSPELGESCSALESVGFALSKLGGGKTKAALGAVNTGITSWCQSVPDDTNIGAAINSVEKAINDGKAAYKQATGKAI